VSYVSSIGVVGARPLMPGVRPQEGAVRLVVCPLRRNVGHAGARNACSNSSLPGGEASLDGLLTSIPTAARIAPGLLPLVRRGLYGCHTRPVNGYTVAIIEDREAHAKASYLLKRNKRIVNTELTIRGGPT